MLGLKFGPVILVYSGAHTLLGPVILVCTPVSVSLYCRTRHHPGLRRGLETKCNDFCSGVNNSSSMPSLHFNLISSLYMYYKPLILKFIAIFNSKRLIHELYLTLIFVFQPDTLFALKYVTYGAYFNHRMVFHVFMFQLWREPSIISFENTGHISRIACNQVITD